MGGPRKYSVNYQPMPKKTRFWFHAESCYTEAELELRTWIIKTRAHSGIHQDYLATPSSWFAEDEQALINHYEHSWFFSDAYRPRQQLAYEDFFVQPVDHQHLAWPQLFLVMQKIGDYLLIRNKNLPISHLNQPFNFVLLDLVRMLRAMSQNNHIEYTQKQIEHLIHYVRTIETKISPVVGSDRLFLANLRAELDEDFLPMLHHLFESQLLKELMVQLNKNIHQFSFECNLPLHFGLSPQKVNPHPYGFDTQINGNLKEHPTLAAKSCAQNKNELIKKDDQAFVLTAEQLKTCADFSLITNDPAILEDYGRAITHLNQLSHFEKILEQTIHFLGQAGEVYTVHQFREQLLQLMQQISALVEEATSNIGKILHVNTQTYYQAIQEEQKMPLLRKMFRGETDKRRTFIKNQDTMSQFPSTSHEIQKTQLLIKENIAQINSYLNQAKSQRTNVVAVAHQAQELNRLIEEIHGWIKLHHNVRNLPEPRPPEKVLFLSEQSLTQDLPPDSKIHLPECQARSPYLFVNNLSVNNLSQNQLQQYRISGWIGLGILMIIPLALIILYLVCRPHKPDAERKFKFQKKLSKLEDSLVDVQRIVDEDHWQEIRDDYKKLQDNADRGHYDLEMLARVSKELAEELEQEERFVSHH